MQTLYHMQTKDQRRKKTIVRIVVLVCLVVLCVAAVFAYRAFHQHSLEQGALSVKEAVLESAIQCAAIEGSYPSELSYLEEKYGLNINHNDYVVMYICFSSNNVPSVSVVPR